MNVLVAVIQGVHNFTVAVEGAEVVPITPVLNVMVDHHRGDGEDFMVTFLEEDLGRLEEVLDSALNLMTGTEADHPYLMSHGAIEDLLLTEVVTGILHQGEISDLQIDLITCPSVLCQEKDLTDVGHCLHYLHLMTLVVGG